MLNFAPNFRLKRIIFNKQTKYLIIKVMKRTTIMEYTAPMVEVCSVAAERGFFVSQNPGLNYGEAGNAGAIENGNSYEL